VKSQHYAEIWTESEAKEIISLVPDIELGNYHHQRADEKHGNPPQGNQELLVVRDESWKTPPPQVSLG